MKDSLDNSVQKLQKQIYEDIKETFSSEVFDRWLNFTHRGNIDAPDGYALVKGRCGDTIEIFLKFDNERVN